MSDSDQTDPRAERVLRLFGPAPHPWVRETPTDHDVLVVGAGQAGLGIGFALRRAGIARASVIDGAAPGATGVWETTARMRRLRTPKTWPEPEFGFPELSFRAWYTDGHGEDGFASLDRIPRPVWAEYVAWFERTVRVPVRHHTRLESVEPADDHLVAHLAVTAPDGSVVRHRETTRKLILANGVEGTGGPALPAGLADLPPHLAAHTGEPIDFEALAGRTVAVLGAGASALDAAGTALEAGAREVHLFTRRPELLIQGPAGFGPQSLGHRENFHRRSDADRWRLKVAAARAGRSCTLESVERSAVHPGFRVHLGAPWESAVVDGDAVRIEAADGVHVVDFVIAGTGFQYDPRTRPELAAVADRIALWGDRYLPPAELQDADLARWPYLGDAYELVARHDEDAAWAGRIHVFSAAAGLSFGIPVGDTQSLATGIPRLVDAIGRDLYFEDLTLPPLPAPAPAEPVSYRHLYQHAIWSPELAPATT